MNRKKLILNPRSLAVFAVIFLAGYWISVQENHRVPEVYASEAQAAPDITLPRLDGGDATLKQYRGQWVLLNFWATWCKPCVAEMPSLDAFYRKFKKKNVEVLAVSLDRADKDHVKDFVKKHGLSFPVFYDPSNESGMPFGVNGLPSTYIINPEGKVVAQAFGERDWDDPLITRYMENLMKKE